MPSLRLRFFCPATNFAELKTQRGTQTLDSAPIAKELSLELDRAVDTPPTLSQCNPTIAELV
jgi:hypothetical protein